MNQLPEHISLQIKEEADKYGFRVPYDGSTNYYNEDRVKGYQDGAKVYANKWLETVDIMYKLASIVTNIYSDSLDNKTKEIVNQSLHEYNNYKQTNNDTVNG